ncbi:MAG TPA: LamG-like jellyroll fold domain-containing protein, partial [Vicinamibacterales bacterium]|nr:LamG-like jellyroll fold domain-containing protein [Vicinamibacterales bacterium]
YVDGALVSSSATTTTPVAAGAQTTQIGKSATQQFNGALDEVAIYARALTAAEIADHYAARTDRYNVTIAGVYRDIQPGFSISETANGRNRLDCAVLSTNGSYRAALEDEVILTEDGTRIMGGVIDRPVESGFGDTGATTAIVQRISAADFNVYPSRVRITADIAAGTMKAALQVVANALAAQGVTLDPAQVAGPALPALSYEDKPAIDVLNEITALASGSAATSYVWEVDYTKTLRAFEAGTLAAPFNVTDGDGNLQGDIVVEQPRTSAYANYILLYGGTGQRDVIDQFVANGVTATFQLGYTLAAGRGYVNVGGTVSGGVISGGVNETFPGTWTYNATTNQITRTSPPPAGAVNLPYTAQFQRAVIADGGLPAAQRVARTYKAEDTFDKDVLQALANSYLARDMASPKTVRYTAAYAKTGLHPGQVQTITSTKRNLSGTFLITDVRIVHVGGSLVRREVTAVSTTRLPKTLRESFQQTFGGSGSTSAAAGTVTVVSSGGVGGSGTAGKLAKWATSATLGDSILSESGSTVTVAGTLAATTFSGSGASLTSLPAAQLTGTIPAATLTGRSLADLGTRSAADLSSGTLAYARMPSGAGTWTATPTISGAVILQDTLAVTGASTLTGTVTVGGTITTPVTTDLTLSPTGVIVAAKSIIPAATDTYDLGRFDRLWNQSYISQMNALVFARTTQTLFGGYSSIGKNAGAFAADVASAATTIDFGQAMTPNDFVLVRAHDTGGTIKAEYLQVGTLVSGTTYNVTRDLAAAHVTDPAWASGTPYLVLGTTNDGRIDLFAYDGKPRIVFTQQGATYNAQSDRGILGNLNSYFGYATDVYGAAFGDASAANITIDPTNGFRVRQGTTTYAQLASSVFTVGNPSGKRIGWDGTNLTVVSDYVTLDNTGIALAPDTTGLFVTTNAYRWSVSHGWMGIGGSDTAGGNRVITIDAFNDTYTAGRDSYVQLLARTKNSSSNQVQAGIVLRAPASGTATVAVDSALVQATGAYIYPGSASGLSANQ